MRGGKATAKGRHLIKRICGGRRVDVVVKNEARANVAVLRFGLVLSERSCRFVQVKELPVVRL